LELGDHSRHDVWEQDPLHKQKGIYSLTEMAIQLVPVITALGAWGRKHLPATEELSIRAQLLEEGGSDLWNEFMQELRGMHLIHEADTKDGEEGKPSVLARLNDAYLEISHRNGAHVEASK
jgi:hypothetical protein